MAETDPITWYLRNKKSSEIPISPLRSSAKSLSNLSVPDIVGTQSSPASNAQESSGDARDRDVTENVSVLTSSSPVSTVIATLVPDSTLSDLFRDAGRLPRVDLDVVPTSRRSLAQTAPKGLMAPAGSQRFISPSPSLETLVSLATSVSDSYAQASDSQPQQQHTTPTHSTAAPLSPVRPNAGTSSAASTPITATATATGAVAAAAAATPGKEKSPRGQTDDSGVAVVSPSAAAGATPVEAHSNGEQSARSGLRGRSDSSAWLEVVRPVLCPVVYPCSQFVRLCVD